MKPVIVRNIRIGEGIPKICVPIVGRNREEILQKGKFIICPDGFGRMAGGFLSAQ